MIEGALVLKSLIDVIDRFIQLIGVRDSKAQQRFGEIIEPIFDDLSLIHSDYHVMFCKVNSMLPPADEIAHLRQEDISRAIEAATWLSENRLKLLNVRAKTRILASEAAKSSFSKQEREFLTELVGYFEDVSLLRGDLTPSFLLEKRLTEFAKLAKSSVPNEVDLVQRAREIRQMIEFILPMQERRWKKILVEFARMKIASANR